MKELIVATRNTGKLREIRRLCENHGIAVVGLENFPDIPDVIEDGDTFAANAIKKADTIAQLTGLPCLADDSGLVVEALDGQPGVHSARYAGDDATDQDNNHKLLKEMENLPDSLRRAAFCCVMALCVPGQPPKLFHGRVEGQILFEPRGTGGFGYDPLFMVLDYNQTMAELPLDIKNRISHRGQALRKVLADLASMPP